MTPASVTPEFDFASFTFPRYIPELPRGANPAQRLAYSKDRMFGAASLCGVYYTAPKPAVDRRSARDMASEINAPIFDDELDAAWDANESARIAAENQMEFESENEKED